MKLGDTGLKVDYIVSKLKDVYPEMDAGSSIGWNSVNTKYLDKYLHEYMPDLVPMLNISSNSITETTLLMNRVPEGSGNEMILSVPDNMDLLKVTYNSTIGESVDTHKGSPYSEVPLKVIAFPVNKGTNYKLIINWNDKDNKPINYNDITENDENDPRWDLFDYYKYAIVQGPIIGSGIQLKSESLVNDESQSHYSDRYFKIPGFKYGIKFNQSIQPLATDRLILSGKFFINGSSRGGSGISYRLIYDNTNERGRVVQLDTENNETNFEYYINKGDVLTLDASDINTKLILHRKSNEFPIYPNNTPTSTNPEMTDISIQVVDQKVSGVSINSSLRVLGSAICAINDNNDASKIVATFKYIEYKEKKLYINDKSMVVLVDPENSHANELTINNNDEFIMDGVKYVNLSGDNVNINTTNSITSTIEYSKVSTKLVSVDIDTSNNITTISNNEMGSTKVHINDDQNGYTLLIQVPKSVVNYSLLQISDSGKYEVDPLEFSKGDNTVTSDYLDLILLDRTITPYSDPDDIEWAQFLSVGTNAYESTYSELGVYDDHLIDLVKEIQRTDLGRTNYVTGYIDPETEIFMEVKIGY